MLACFNKHSAEVQQLGERVSHLEDAMSACTTSYNTIVDAHDSHSKEIPWLKAKVADPGNHSHRNNLKIRGIPERIQASQLPHYVQNLFLAVAQSLQPVDLTIDRSHRIPKPSFLPQETSRDILMRIHFYQVKEKILVASCQKDTLPEHAASLRSCLTFPPIHSRKRKTFSPSQRFSEITKLAINGNTQPL